MPPQLAVHADLQLRIDGHTATVQGDGADVIVRCEQPAKVVAGILSAALPFEVGRVDGVRALGALADNLERSGLRVQIGGPGEAFLVLGRGQRSRVGRLVTGSTHVRPGGVRSWVPLLAAEVAARGRPLIRPVAGSLAAGALLIGAGLLRRGRRAPGHSRPRRRRA